MSMFVPDLGPAIGAIRAARAAVPADRSLLVGVSGIDGSGKGFVTDRLVAPLRDRGVRVEPINVDGWLNLPARRFDPARPAEHFYEHGLRLVEMFDRLVLPLQAHRSVRLLAELADATNADTYGPYEYRFTDVDVILLEGIFLFKRAFRDHFDLRLWVDCSFATALDRTVRRGQEGLPPAETVRDFEAIYFPAQRLHFVRDDPRGSAHLVIPNDPDRGDGP
jgi:uridine kinase